MMMALPEKATAPRLASSRPPLRDSQNIGEAVAGTLMVPILRLMLREDGTTCFACGQCPRPSAAATVDRAARIARSRRAGRRRCDRSPDIDRNPCGAGFP